MTQIKVEVDPGQLLGRALSDLERRQLPFATMRAINETGAAVQQRWKEVMPRVFDRPAPLTLNAVRMKRASLQDPVAVIRIMDEAFKGTPPAKYLAPQVEGGARRHKRFERALQAKGLMPAGYFAVPGRGAQLDPFGNLRAAQIVQILAQVRAFGEQGYKANETDDTRGRRQKRQAKRGERRGDFFAVPVARGGLKPGIYQRVRSGFGTGVVPVVVFVRTATYRARFPIFDLAQKTFDRRFPEIFRSELDKAVRGSFGRAFR